MVFDVEKWHPKLIGKNYKIIESDTNISEYNCVAFVLDIFDEWCGPTTSSWPWEKLSRSRKLDNYIKYFNMYGYEQCDEDYFEKDYDKIAIYIDENNGVNHVAKQFGNMWRSKLGPSCILEHELDWISGNDFNNYGQIGAIIKKKK